MCGVKSKGKESEWYAAEGVYLPRIDKKPKQAAGSGDGGGDDGSGPKDEL